MHVLLSTYLYLHVYVAEGYSLCNSVISLYRYKHHIITLQLGQTPVEEAEGSIRAFLRTFEVCSCILDIAFIDDN